MEVLKTVKENARLPSEREHVTPYIHNHSEIFSRKNMAYIKDLSHIRLTMDTVEDFDLLEKLAPYVFESGEYRHMEDILNYLDEHPYLLEINKMYKRNEGYQKSLEQDAAI